MNRHSLFACLAFSLVACQPSEESPSASMHEMPPPAVTVSHPIQQNIIDWDEFTGRLEASQSVKIFSQVTGYLEEIGFQDGAEVKKGQTLFKIDARPFQAVLAQAQAQFEQAEVRRDHAKQELDRAQALVQAKAISTEQFDTRFQTLREAEAGLRLAQAAVERAKIDVDYCVITAPMDGQISRRKMDVGGLVIGGPMGATELTDLVSIDPIYAYIDIDEASILRYQRLQREGKGAQDANGKWTCKLSLADSTKVEYDGVIDFIDPQLDPQTGTVQVRVLLENPKPATGNRPLQAGFFVRVRVPATQAYPAVLIDDRAIVSDQSSKLVMVVDAEGTMQPKPVVLGPLQNGLRVIREGLTPEDRVIVNGISKAQPGMKVEAQTASADAQ